VVSADNNIITLKAERENRIKRSHLVKKTRKFIYTKKNNIKQIAKERTTIAKTDCFDYKMHH